MTGCTKVSPGCDRCYAETFTNRFKRHAFEEVQLHTDRLGWPGALKKPSKIFVCSMGDLFHGQVPWEFVWAVFEAMKFNPQHTFQVLTKRPGRMAWFADHWLENHWPANVWAGTSVESQKYAPRLDVLARVPAKVRFVSYEPALEPVDFRPWLASDFCANCGDGQPYGQCCTEPFWIDTPLIHWVIAGGESGPRARPAHPDWIRKVRDDCQAAAVPFFFKQWGEWAPALEYMNYSQAESHFEGNPTVLYSSGHTMGRVGKKAAGARLDGQEWREMPAPSGVR